MEKPAGMEGLNIWNSALKGEKLRDQATTVWGTVATVVTDRWWYNSNLWGEGRRLFDMTADPYHENNLAEAEPEICAKLLEIIIQKAGGLDKLPAQFG